MKLARHSTIALVLLLFSVSVSYSQAPALLSGEVSDARSGEPLPGAHVVLAGTTIGAATGADGSFTIREIPPGKYHVVASMVGYTPKEQLVEFAPGRHVTLSFELKEHTNELRGINVEARVDRAWQRAYESFQREMIGSDEYARQCKVLNPYILTFEREPDNLIATAPEPLIIENRALGYRITYLLKVFEYGETSRQNTIFWNGLPAFVEMTPASAEEAERWRKNRERAYQGTLQHFLWMLIHDPELSKSYQMVWSEGVKSGNQLRREEVLTSLDEGHWMLNAPSLTVYYKRHESTDLTFPWGPVPLEDDGTFFWPSGIQTKGEMGKHRLSRLLPRDYPRQP